RRAGLAQVASSTLPLRDHLPAQKLGGDVVLVTGLRSLARPCPGLVVASLVVERLGKLTCLGRPEGSLTHLLEEGARLPDRPLRIGELARLHLDRPATERCNAERHPPLRHL